MQNYLGSHVGESSGMNLIGAGPLSENPSVLAVGSASGVFLVAGEAGSRGLAPPAVGVAGAVITVLDLKAEFVVLHNVHAVTRLLCEVNKNQNNQKTYIISVIPILPYPTG